MKTYFKRNKDNDTDNTKSFFNGKCRIGYELLECYNEDEEKKAIKNGYTRSLRAIENVQPKKRTKRNTKASTESDGCRDELNACS